MNRLKDELTISGKALAEAKRAVRGNTGLAEALPGKISPQAISQWKQVPAKRVLDVEHATGVSRYRLRPDIYPSPDRQQETAS
jgi:DNA-binding transcriptional regulator YdaS (Cro superfamily)